MAVETEYVAGTIEGAQGRYSIQGTGIDLNGGPPWFLIDTSTEDPEVGWPGGLIAEYPDRQGAREHRSRLIADAATKAVFDGMLDPAPSEALQEAAGDWTVMDWTIYRRVIAAQRKELFPEEGG